MRLRFNLRDWRFGHYWALLGFYRQFEDGNWYAPTSNGFYFGPFYLDWMGWKRQDA